MRTKFILSRTLDGEGEGLYTLKKAIDHYNDYVLEFSYDKIKIGELGEKFYRLHRDDDEPSLVSSNGSKHWFNEGELHRENGPAVIGCHMMRWHVKGKMHRLDGPAIMYKRLHDNQVTWWVHDRHIPIEEIDRIIKHHEINPDWTQWTEGEKLIMRLALS